MPSLCNEEVPCRQPILNSFMPVSVTDLRDVVTYMKPSSCPGDEMPVHFFIKVFDIIGPYLLSIINCLLSSGYVSKMFKVACFQPLLKKNLVLIPVATTDLHLNC